MKKIIPIILVFSILITGVFAIAFHFSNQTGLEWEYDIICVRKAQTDSYVSYPRMIKLNNETLICAYDTDMEMACVTSNDGGLTWSKDQVIIAEIDRLNCANAALMQLESGELLCAYRATGIVDTKFYATIKVSSSFDNGKTWKYHSTVIETKQDNDEFFGVWEPYFGFIDDKLAVFYSNDSQNDAVNNPGHQNIEFKLWYGKCWNKKHITSAGDETNSRDGMPVWCKISSGEYIMAIETTELKDNKFYKSEFSIIALTSKNGLTWDRNGYIYIPPVFSEANYAGAPYILELPDGRLCVSMQTNEGENGNICGILTTKNVADSKIKPSDFTKPFYPFGKDSQQNWNGMYINENYLLVFSAYEDSNGSYIMLRRAKL